MLDLKNASYNDIRPHKPTLWHRFELWMINDGKKYMYFGFWILIEALMFAISTLNYTYYPQWQDMYHLLGGSFTTARAAALVLHVNTALVLFPVCRTVISWTRATPLNRIIPFDHALLFHKVVGYSILFFTLVHMGSHYRNYYMVAKATGTPYWRILFTTGHSITGHIMMACIVVMSVTGYKKVRQKHFNAFWYLHHLFVVYFACFSIHGAFCLLKRNLPPYCATGASFWKYWVTSGVVYLFERLSREWRAGWRANQMKVQKVILHPGKVIEVQFRKPRGFKGLAGQYAFLNCPAVSTQQWHPFTLTSAPEEDYVSVHVRLAGDWTKKFAETLGAQEDNWKALEASLEEQKAQKQPATHRQSVMQRREQLGRDSLAFSPISLGDRDGRRNTALSANRRNTVLLVDQSGQSTAAAAPAAPAAPAVPAVPAMPEMPSLQQLQEYYLRQDKKKVKNSDELPEEYEMAETSYSKRKSAFNENTRDMREFQAIVNGERDQEMEGPLGVPINRPGGHSEQPAAPQAHLTASVLPQVMVDGPFGSASEDVFNHEVAMLFCAGIGCTPFASVLKSIWYRLSYPEGAFRLRKVYFFWVQRDTKSFEWFQDLLKAIEEEDEMRMEMVAEEYGSQYSLANLNPRYSRDQMIEIHTYLTGKLSMMQMEHVHMNEEELDPITGLRSPTNFGRPNMDLIFQAVAHTHPASDVGVFFCGPPKLGSSIESAAKKWSSEGADGTKFFYNKENF